MHLTSWVCTTVTLGAAVLLSAISSPAQTLSEGEIHGVVLDAQGSPLNDVSVEIFNQNGFSRTVRSARDGSFSVVLLPPGVYDVRLEILGYRPLVVTGVDVVAGGDARFEARATPVAGGAIRVDSLAYANIGTSVASPESRGILSGSRLEGPGRAATFGDIAAFAGRADYDQSLDGLPPGAGTTFLDGTPNVRARRSFLDKLGDDRLGVPRLALESAQLTRNPLDVVWSGEGGSAWRLVTRPAPQQTTVETQVRGAYMATEMPEEAGSAAGFDVGLFAGTGLSEEVAVLVAIEAEKEPPSPFVSRLGEHVDALRGQIEAFGVDATALATPTGLGATSVSALAGADRRSGSHVVRGRARFSMTQPDGEAVGLPWFSIERRPDESDWGIAASVSSLLGSWVNELHLGVENSRRSYPGAVESDAASTTPIVPLTFVLPDPGFGVGAGMAGESGRRSMALTDVATLRAGDHRLQVGVAASSAKHTLRRVEDAGSSFLFGSLQDFRDGRGYFVGLELDQLESEFSTGQIAAFAQDQWSPGGGLELFLGLRGEVELRRPDELVPRPTWFQFTSTLPTLPPTNELKILPRAGFTLAVSEGGGWAVDGGIGLYSEEFDPAVLHELYSELGTTRLQRGFGSTSGWPAAPDSLTIPFVGHRLSIADGDLHSPRTLRGSLGLGGSLWSGGSLRVEAAYRWTDRLPRYADLNLLPEPVGQDQYGRPIFGSLVQHGSLIFAEPRTNRRFAEFDAVSLIRSDGESRYLGVTMSLEHSSTWLDLGASVTRSETVDNWPTLGAGGVDRTYEPLTRTEDPDFWYGTSDFDIPVSAAVRADVRLPIGLQLASLYTYRSGAAFTPRFQPGVDVNGDGFSDNDPVSVDSSLPGAVDVIGRWDCLATDEGYVERNSCRLPGVSAIDFRLTAPVSGWGELHLDLSKAFGTAEYEPDRALYLIDPAANLQLDPTTGTYVLPLLVNGSFGEPLIQREQPWVVRFGFSAGF